MKIWKWNVGLKGIVAGGFGLLIAAVVGKIAEDTVGNSITKVEPEDTTEETTEISEDSTEEKEPDEETGETVDAEVEITEF